MNAQGITGAPAAWLHSVTVDNVHPNTTVAIKVNGLSGDASVLRLYARGVDGKLIEVDKALWTLEGVEGEMKPDDIYEIHVNVEDNGTYDANETEKALTIAVMLVSE